MNSESLVKGNLWEYCVLLSWKLHRLSLAWRKDVLMIFMEEGFAVFRRTRIQYPVKKVKYDSTFFCKDVRSLCNRNLRYLLNKIATIRLEFMVSWKSKIYDLYRACITSLHDIGSRFFSPAVISISVRFLRLSSCMEKRLKKRSRRAR